MFLLRPKGRRNAPCVPVRSALSRAACKGAQWSEPSREPKFGKGGLTSAALSVIDYHRCFEGPGYFLPAKIDFFASLNPFTHDTAQALTGL
jgi:hypothetical protein